MKGVARWALLLVLLAATVVGGSGLFLLFAGRWLANADQPLAADAMVVLAGEPSRAVHAANLYSKGFAPLVCVSKPALTHSQKLLAGLGLPFPPQEQLYQEILLRKGVPEDRIRVIGKGALRTVEEAMAARELPLGEQRTLLVVTSPYHVRRVKMVFSDVLPQARVIVVANPHEPYPRRWWTNQDVARNVVLETIKIVFHLLGGGFPTAATS